MRKKIVIYGAGVCGKQLFFDVERYGALDVAAFTMDEQYIRENRACGLPLVPFETVEEAYPPDAYDMIAMCGYTIMANRAVMYRKAKQKGYALANYVSPKAILENEITMGDNNVILANAFVGFDCVLGSDIIIRQNVYLGHESTVGDHTIISSGCQIGGRSTIGDFIFFGIGVTARDQLAYGRESMIGVGSNVVKDAEPRTIYFGSPAKARGERSADDPIV